MKTYEELYEYVDWMTKNNHIDYVAHLYDLHIALEKQVDTKLNHIGTTEGFNSPAFRKTLENYDNLHTLKNKFFSEYLDEHKELTEEEKKEHMELMEEHKETPMTGVQKYLSVLTYYYENNQPVEDLFECIPIAYESFGFEFLEALHEFHLKYITPPADEDFTFDSNQMYETLANLLINEETTFEILLEASQKIFEKRGKSYTIAYLNVIKEIHLDYMRDIQKELDSYELEFHEQIYQTLKKLIKNY